MSKTKWPDGTKKSTNNVFDWKSSLNEESVMLKDRFVKAKSTITTGKATGRIPLVHKKTPLIIGNPRS